MTAVQIVYVFVRLGSQSKNVNLPQSPEDLSGSPYCGKPDCLASQPARNISAKPPDKHHATVPRATSAPTVKQAKSATSVQMTVRMPPISVQAIETTAMMVIAAANSSTRVH